MPRLFIAIDIPDDIVYEIKLIQDYLSKSKLIVGNFIKPEKLHLTLKFIGEIEQKFITQIQTSLKNIKFEPFEISIENIEMVPQRSTRIIWFNLKSPELEVLQNKIEDNLEWLQTNNKLNQNFRAHITFIRIKTITNEKKLKDLISSIVIAKTKFSVRSFSLIESKLTQEESLYTEIDKFYSE